MTKVHWGAIALLVAVFSAAALGQVPAKHPATPEELVGIVRLTGVDLSPDGTRVLYGATRINYPASENSIGHIYLLPAAGGEVRQMTASDAGESAPCWSPDGTRFAFLSRRSGSPQIFVMPANGGEGVQLGKLAVAPQGIKWSPDGKAIAFLAVPEPSAGEKAEKEKTGGAEVMEAPRDMTQLFTMGYPEAGLRQVTPGDFNVSDFTWAPDGKSFALVTARTQLLYDNMIQASVRVVDLEGKTVAVISRGEGPVQGPPEFSPDGTRVAWRYPTEGLSNMNGVALCRVDGSGFFDAAAKVDLHFSQIAWMPDGMSLMALTIEGTRSCLRRLDPATGKAELVYAPAGVMSGFDMDKVADRLAVVFTDPDTPDNAWILKCDGTGAVRLTDLNPQVREWILPSVEKIRYESAKGVMIEALFDKTPITTGPGVPPLMVMPHGGPDWVDQEGFDNWVTYMAGQGYNILRVNFRGSLAYGLAFYVANRGKQGFVDYDDIMAGVETLVKRGQADRQKLVIGGWSYGGCMTEWAICRTDRFKAAVVGAGVANYLSNYAQSDINHGFAGEWEFLGNPYDNPENYMKDSAVFHIRAVKTPVLILHGQQDERVPYAQGLELYRALKTTGKQVEMVSYPGEGHGLRKPAHRIDCLKRWSAFYDRALGITRPEPK
jgi:dipeptidyl aminopeptidase/acylaminoacyl peptidase